jgi:hypothetical protein
MARQNGSGCHFQRQRKLDKGIFFRTLATNVVIGLCLLYLPLYYSMVKMKEMLNIYGKTAAYQGILDVCACRSATKYAFVIIA